MSESAFGIDHGDISKGISRGAFKSLDRVAGSARPGGHQNLNQMHAVNRLGAKAAGQANAKAFAQGQGLPHLSAGRQAGSMKRTASKIGSKKGQFFNRNFLP